MPINKFWCNVHQKYEKQPCEWNIYDRLSWADKDEALQGINRNQIEEAVKKVDSQHQQGREDKPDQLDTALSIIDLGVDLAILFGL